MTQAELEGILSRTQILEPLGQYDAALRDLDVVRDRAAEEGLVGFQATALYHRAKILRILGDLDSAEREARQAFALYATSGEEAGQAQALLVLGEIFSDQAKLGEMEQVSREAIALSIRAAAPLVEARGHTVLGTALVYQGKGDEARAQLEQAAAIYGMAGDRRGLATSLLTLGRIDHMQGRLQAATVAITQAFEMFRNLEDRRAMAASCFALGQINFERGDVDAAMSFSEQGVALTDSTGEMAMRLRCLLLLSHCEVESGRWQVAMGRLQKAEDLCRTHGQQGTLPEVYRVLAQAYLGSGAIDEARHYAQLGMRTADEQDVYSRGTTQVVLGLVLQREGRLEESRETLRQALVHLEAADEAYELGWCHLVTAQLLLSNGDHGGAVDHLHAARVVFVALEAEAKLELIGQLLRESA